MSDGSANKGLRERLTSSTEDHLGKALTDLFDNPLLNGALGRAADAREKATQAQELAMGALNLPSAADVERLTRRLRSVSLRLEGIEDGVHRLGRVLPSQALDTRLAAIEEQLRTLTRTVADVREGLAERRAAAGGNASSTRAEAKRSPARTVGAKPPVKAAAKPSAVKAKRAPAAKRRPAKRTATKQTAAKHTAASTGSARRAPST